MNLNEMSFERQVSYLRSVLSSGKNTLLGIEVLNHVMIGRGEYYRFADKDELWKEQKLFPSR